MVDKDTLRLALEMYISDQITQEELSKWAYDVLVEADGKGDPLLTEILFCLVNFDEAGLVFDKYKYSLEKLEYFINWLEDDEKSDWPDYTTFLDPTKLM